jgi:dienelactone hydrolase
MKNILIFLLLSLLATPALADGTAVTYTMGDETFEGYYISPRDGAPLVVLVHDWDGLTDYEIKRSRMLADMGYAVFAVDLFGAGIRPTENKDKKQLTGELYKDRQRMRSLVQAAVDAAKSQGARVDNAVVMGYCFGGAAVLEYARSGADMKGFATFHGGIQTPEGQDYAKAKGAYLIQHGSADTSVTLDQLAALGGELEAAGLQHQLISYSGAPHAFTVFGTDRYREDADRKSWLRFGEYLAEVLR